MRNIILFIATSLDGCISRADGGTDWLFTDQDYGYAEFYAGVDTIVMGRKTYDQAVSSGGYPYPGKQTFVFSRSKGGSRDANAQFIAEDVKSFMNGLRLKQGKNIWLVGGSELVRAFLMYDLLDVMIISVLPVILGNGIPLFRAPVPARQLKFVDCTTFNTGLVQVTYVRQGG